MTFFQTPYEKQKNVPDIQIYHFQNILENIELMKNYGGFPNSYYPASYYDAITVNPTLISVKSRGTVRLNYTDPVWSYPRINLNYLTHPDDVKTIVKATEITSKLFKTKAFRNGGIKKYTKPVEACKHLKFESPQYFECAVKKYSRPGLHLTGTCKMGPKNDKTAVVDPQLRVHGMTGLRVMDASIMPNVPRGNSYSPTIMIAEKGSDLIKQEWL